MPYWEVNPIRKSSYFYHQLFDSPQTQIKVTFSSEDILLKTELFLSFMSLLFMCIKQKSDFLK